LKESGSTECSDMSRHCQLCIKNNTKVARRLSNLDACWQHGNVPSPIAQQHSTASTVFDWSTSVSDRQTDRQTDGRWHIRHTQNAACLWYCDLKMLQIWSEMHAYYCPQSSRFFLMCIASLTQRSVFLLSVVFDTDLIPLTWLRT